MKKKAIETIFAKELAEAEAKVIDSLASYKFAMFGYLAGLWIHLNRVSRSRQSNPFKDLVMAARKLRKEAGHEHTP